MKNFMVCLLPIFILSACGSESDTNLDSCLGFSSPAANIYVKDANTLEFIATAEVWINSIGENATAQEQALYTDESNTLSNREVNAYFTFFELNEPNWLINFHVTAPGYEEFYSSEYEFVVQTSCGAENNFIQEVVLCPIGETCN